MTTTTPEPAPPMTMSQMKTLVNAIVVGLSIILGGGVGIGAAHVGQRELPPDVREAVQQSTKAVEASTAYSAELARKLEGLQLTLTEMKSATSTTTRDVGRQETRLDALEARIRSLETRNR